VQWWDLGGQIQLAETASAKEVLESRRGIQGLMERLGAGEVNSHSSPEAQVSAAEILLEGLQAHRLIGRSEERVFKADKTAKRPERAFERENDPQAEDFPPRKNRRPYN